MSLFPDQCRIRLRTVPLVLAALALHAGCACGQSAKGVTLYVATNGNDMWSGRLPDPDAAGTDGPVATAPQALARARALPEASRTTGPIRIQFRAGAHLWHEWRDSANPYRVGPSLRFRPNGALEVGGRTLCTVPHDTWITVAVRCPLGDAAGTYDLEVAWPGHGTQAFKGLSTGTKEWRSLHWIGFVSEATDTAECFIDDLAFAPED